MISACYSFDLLRDLHDLFSYIRDVKNTILSNILIIFGKNSATSNVCFFFFSLNWPHIYSYSISLFMDYITKCLY